jgi:glucose-6-phosphate 1-epimerase
MNKPTLQNLNQLNAEFSNPNLKFIEVGSGLIKAVLSFGKKASAQVHLQGAHVSQWQDTQGRENLFTSTKTIYKAGVAIRGGNPIIFPQFGPGEICQHGFARQSVWEVVATDSQANATTISLQLKPKNVAHEYRLQWPLNFIVTLTVSLGESLTTYMVVENPNRYPLPFTHAFHTYLAVDDINSVEISDFSNLDYMDNLQDRAIFPESRAVVTIHAATDRRYQNIANHITIKDKSTGRWLVMTNKNCADAFVWNPWQQGEKKLADLEPGSYQKFVCVEPGNMKKVIIVPEGQSFIAVQEIKRLD